MASPAAIALEGGDPRQPSVVRIGDKEIAVGAGMQSAATGTKVHDPSVTFEEYLYHARVSRTDERFEELNPDYRIWGMTIKRNRHGGETIAQHIAQVMGGEVIVHPASVPSPPASENVAAVTGEKGAQNEKTDGTIEPTRSSSQSMASRFGITEDEYIQASRALRTSSWSAVFYLMTTDILGPFQVPLGFAYMGYGPGVVLYTIFGFFAAYGGFLLWKMFLALDSDRYPLRSYGDIAYRIYGPWARVLCSGLQAIQLLLSVAIIIIQNGLSLEQVVVGSGSPGVCFVVLCLVWAIAGSLLGQIRTLKNIAWIGNISIWLNVFTIIMIMVVVVHSPPNYDAAASINGPLLGYTASSPHDIMTTGGAPPGSKFSVQVQGLLVAIYAYSGASIFIEMMAEMKKPFDFWKGMITAQLFIYFFYMMFGLFVYSFQGRYTLNPAYQSISPYTWQTVGNSIQLVTSLIAALLYGNVGLKVVYNTLGRDLLRFPDLASKKGKILWAGIAPVYWMLCFVIGAAIPNVTNLSSLVAAIATLHFSYTFPVIFFVGYLVKRDAMLPTDGFNPADGSTIRGDSGMTRWIRGYKKRWALNTFHMVIFFGALTLCGIGIYSAAEGAKAAYATGVQSSFSCYSAYNPAP